MFLCRAQFISLKSTRNQYCAASYADNRNSLGYLGDVFFNEDLDRIICSYLQNLITCITFYFFVPLALEMKQLAVVEAFLLVDELTCGTMAFQHEQA